jgi:hypothetical protein
MRRMRCSIFAIILAAKRRHALGLDLASAPANARAEGR